MTQALTTTAPVGALSTTGPQRGIPRILDVYAPGGVANLTHTLDAIATISAGYRKKTEQGHSQPVVSRDGTIYVHDPAHRAPRLAAKLAANGSKYLDIAFPFDNPELFVQQRFMRYTATALQVYGDEESLTEIKGGKHIRHEAGTPEYEAILPTCKNATSVYFTGAGWVDGKPKVQLWDGVGFYRLRTTGRHSIRALSASISLCQELTGGRLAGAPFRLKLDYRDVAGPDGAQRNVPVWTITLSPPEEIELDPDRFVLVMSQALHQGRTLLQLAAPRPETITDHELEIGAIGGAVDEDPEYADFTEMLDEDAVLEEDAVPVVEPEAEPPAIVATSTQVQQMVSGEAPCDPQPYIAAWHSAVRDTPYASNEARRTWIFAYTEGRPGGQTDSLAEFLEGSARVTAASEREASGMIVAIQQQLAIEEQARIRERTNELLGGRSALAVFQELDERRETEPAKVAPPVPEPEPAPEPPESPAAPDERLCTDQQWAQIEQWVTGRARAGLKRETLKYDEAQDILDEWKPKTK